MKKMIILIVTFVVICANLTQAEASEKIERILSPDGKKIAVMYCPKEEWPLNCRIDIMINDPEPMTIPIVPHNGMYYRPGFVLGWLKWSPDSRFLAFVLEGSIKSNKKIDNFLAVYDVLRKGNYMSEEDNVFYPLQPRRGRIQDFSFSGTKVVVQFLDIVRINGQETVKRCKEKGLHDFTSEIQVTKDLSDLKRKEKAVILKTYCEDVCTM